MEGACRSADEKSMHAGKDKWGRPIIMFDSSVENTTSHEGQMNLLRMNLTHAQCLMANGKACAWLSQEQGQWS